MAKRKISFIIEFDKEELDKDLKEEGCYESIEEYLDDNFIGYDEDNNPEINVIKESLEINCLRKENKPISTTDRFK